jgi:DNA-binding NarL/FixJ family response regulator
MKFLLYLDPSSGSLIVQALVAALAGFTLFYSNLRMKIKSLFSKKEDEEQD